MFILHSSNKTENLVAHLTAVISNAPPASPFAKEVFLIQSQGMERWLSQQLAGQFNVWGNYDFLFPGKFFSSLAQKIDSRLNDAAFDRNRMLWRIEALLRRLDGDDFLPLTQYLSGDNRALKRYQLARQLAQIFDQYQMMRPDMLTDWQHGKQLFDTATERWQKALWQEISIQTGRKHRGALWLDVIAKFNAAEEGAFSHKLPERISVFGINTLPPLLLSYLQGLSRHCQLHLFLLNPAQTFWADLAGKRQRAQDEDVSGHPLLSALGQQGREFQEMLLEQVQFDFEPESFELSESGNNLHRLQNDLLNNQLDDGAQTPLIKDGSISIHACHSRLREVEVLKNQLLAALEQNPELELRDIVVMAPDIEVYEPFIAAVFSDIQHAIADRSLRLSNNALDAFITFLDLSQSRLGWRSVLDLLEQPVVYPGFGLTETDLDLIKHWLQATHVRWGQSAQQRKELGLPEFNENTWQAALDRLLMGYAVGSDEEFVDGILPYPEIEGSSAQALGGLCEFMQLLFSAGADLKQQKILTAWTAQLYYYADRLLAAADLVERRQLNDLLTELSADLADIHHDAVTLPVVVSWLEDRVVESKSSNGFLRGQLTFCSMLPMRSIPFQVIALLGMNEGEFPKIDRNPTFDLLTQHFRKGDRSRRADDRYQFLEILLSARQQLIMTYIGQSIARNETIPPSVVISELLEVLQDSYQLKDLVTREPLQAFSRRYFDGSTGLISFSEPDCATAQALAASKPEPAPWWQGAISTEAVTVIDLDELFSFYRHPQRYFFRRQLDVRYTGIAEQAEEREPFVIDNRDAYAIHHEWIERMLNGEPLSVKKLQAQGSWLSGALGALEFDRSLQAVEQFALRIQDKNLGERLDDLPVDLSVGAYRLIGNLSNRYQHGSLSYRYADLKGKDFVCALLHHLLINRVQPQATYLLSTDDELVLLPEHCDPGLLPAFIDIFRAGQSAPDAFFTEAAFAYIKQAAKLNSSSRAGKPALDAAKEQLARAVQQPYEPELGRLYRSMPDLAPVLGANFEQQCLALLLPVWEAAHLGLAPE